MFAITKEQRARRDVERARRIYVADVHALLASTFNLSEEEVVKHDKAWLAWLSTPLEVWGKVSFGSMNRETALCLLIAEQEFSEAFRARALAGFLAPWRQWVPYGWEVSEIKGRVNEHAWFDTRYIKSDNLGTPSTGWTLENILALAKPSVRLRNFVWGVTAHSVEALARAGGFRAGIFGGAYNNIILSALELLPENDPLGSRLLEGYSGYMGEQVFPFQWLLEAKIPEKWKQLADEKFRTAIMLEEKKRNTSAYAKVWERGEALQGYLHTLEYFAKFSDRKVLPYSVDLFKSQVAFLLEHDFGVPSWDRFISFNEFAIVDDVLDLIQDDLVLSHRFSRYLVFKAGFKPEANTKAAELMWRMFSHFDQEVREKLEPGINQIAARRNQQSERETVKKQTEEVKQLAKKAAIDHVLKLI